MGYIYMAVTADEYELPIYVTDTSRELAKLLGKSVQSVRGELSRVSSGKSKNTGKHLGYRLIKVSDAEDQHKANYRNNVRYEKILELLSLGYSKKEIGAYYGCSAATIRNRIREHEQNAVVVEARIPLL